MVADYLRPYQKKCRQDVIETLSNGSRSTLVVMPTGCGKTETALDTIDQWPDQECGVLCLAHRQELVWQPWERWFRKTGERAYVEMGENKRAEVTTESRVTFASKDSLHEKRLRIAFPDPKAVGLIWVDEAHHMCRDNKSYSHVIDYFMNANPDCRIMGVTATPDRTDEQAMGQMFDSVAFEYPLLDPAGGPSAIGDGWLVNIEQEYVHVDEVDFRAIKTRGGDFVASQLEVALNSNETLKKMTAATMAIANGRKTLCFLPGINAALRQADAMNAVQSGCARAIASLIDSASERSYVIHSQDTESRRFMLDEWSRDIFAYLCNVGVFTEGMDEPGIQMVSMGRPTKSRSLYAQMAGRGTRVLPGVIEGKNPDGHYWRLEEAENRLKAIAESAKPSVTILDFVGNSTHSLLVSSADILGGLYPDDVVGKAKEILERAGERSSRNVREALDQAELEIRKEIEAKRKMAIAKCEYKRHGTNPFKRLNIKPRRETGWNSGRLPTARQMEMLRRAKLNDAELKGMTFTQASQLIGNIIKRREKGLATYAQVRALQGAGVDAVNFTFDKARHYLDRVSANNWKLPHDLPPE